MLHWRLLLSLFLVPGLVTLIVADGWLPQPGLLVVPLTLVTSAFAVEELVEFFESASLSAARWVLHLGCAGIIAGHGLDHWWGAWPWSSSVDTFGPGTGLLSAHWGLPSFVLMLSLSVALARAVQSRERPEVAVHRLVLTAFGLLYIGWLCGFFAKLAFVGPDADATGQWGVGAVLSMLLVTKFGDVGAYFVGRWLGRRKLAPRVSPGKTVEGAIGGVVFSVLAAAAFVLAIAPLVMSEWKPLVNWETGHADLGRCSLWAAYAIVVSLAGMLGDLVESLLKRSVGRKDSSRWMPGFGGVLDLIDSPLLAAPAAYTFWASGLLGS